MTVRKIWTNMEVSYRTTVFALPIVAQILLHLTHSLFAKISSFICYLFHEIFANKVKHLFLSSIWKDFLAHKENQHFTLFVSMNIFSFIEWLVCMLKVCKLFSDYYIIIIPIMSANLAHITWYLLNPGKLVNERSYWQTY